MDDLYMSGYVERLHTRPTIRKYTVAEHTWGVLKHLYCMIPQLSMALVVNALFHDSGEYVSGDIPAPFLRKNPEVNRAVMEAQRIFLRQNLKNAPPPLSQIEKMLLEIADRLDFVDMCCLEKALGNCGLEQEFHTAKEWIRETLNKLHDTDYVCHKEVSRYVEDQFRATAGYYSPGQLSALKEVS